MHACWAKLVGEGSVVLHKESREILLVSASAAALASAACLLTFTYFWVCLTS